MRFHPVGTARDWLRLLRVDRPVGYWLLLWPTMWGLLAASNGRPEPKNLAVFVLGVFLMRSAGCVINDFADRDFDPHVARTRERPIAAGRIAPGAALVGFALMLLLALALVMQTSTLVVELAVVGALLATIYPFLKRVTHAPQAWLGMAFGWGAVMAWAAERGTVTDSAAPWLLFAANVCWSLSYDTAYAIGDREDDARIGVGSMALYLGEKAIPAVLALGAMTMLLLALALLALDGAGEDGRWPWLGWALGAAWQAWISLRLAREGEAWSFRYFLQSHWTGALVAAGLAARGLFPPA